MLFSSQFNYSALPSHSADHTTFDGHCQFDGTFSNHTGFCYRRDAVFVNKGYLQRLEPLLPKVRHMAKKINKKQNPSLREDADAASQNLMRFIKYKAEGN